MVYQFRAGSRYKGNAQAVGEELHRLRKRFGVLKPSIILDAARAKTNVMHKYFQWDDSKAAAEWRLHQARMLVCSVVTVQIDSEETRPVRSFVSVDHKYEPIEVVLSDAQMRQKVLHEIASEIAAMKSKLSAFEELADIIASLDQAEKAVSKHFVRKARKASEKSRAVAR